MKSILLAAVAACAIIGSASSAYACGDRYLCRHSGQVASRNHAYHHARSYHVAHRRAYRKRLRTLPGGYGPRYAGVVTVKTAAGISITVSPAIQDRMLSLIDDMKAHGYVPHSIGCFARGGHVPNSRHYTGNACDFDGSLSVARFFRTEEAESLIRAHGLHSGCDYVLHGVRDCGHVDDMTSFAHRAHVRAYASYRPIHRSYRRYARR